MDEGAFHSYTWYGWGLLDDWYLFVYTGPVLADKPYVSVTKQFGLKQFAVVAVQLVSFLSLYLLEIKTHYWIYIPTQLLLLSILYPSLHLHWWLPGKFIQTELEEQGLYSLHSSTSVCKDKRYMVVAETFPKKISTSEGIKSCAK